MRRIAGIFILAITVIGLLYALALKVGFEKTMLAIAFTIGIVSVLTFAVCLMIEDK
jgi:cytochrome c oxidase subunit IV